MYSVTELKLPEGLSLQLGPSVDFFENESRGTAPLRKVFIPVPDSGGQSISVLQYVVGESISIRKSLMGLRLIKGTPDYSGVVHRTALGSYIPRLVDMHQSNYKELVSSRASGKRSYYSDFSSNLCQEIYLPSDSIARRFDEIVAQRAQHFSHRDVLTRGWGTTVSTPRNEESRRYPPPSTVDFDGDTVGIMDFETFVTRPGVRATGPRGSRDEFDQLQQYLRYINSDNRYITTPRYTETPGPSPEYSPVPTAPVSLARAADAVAEVVTGRRGTPPASRGPRPRNQRW